MYSVHEPYPYPFFYMSNGGQIVGEDARYQDP